VNLICTAKVGRVLSQFMDRSGEGVGLFGDCGLRIADYGLRSADCGVRNADYESFARQYHLIPSASILGGNCDCLFHLANPETVGGAGYQLYFFYIFNLG
jgi:hypothetical protein